MTRYSGVNAFLRVGDAAVLLVKLLPLHFSLLVQAANSNENPKLYPLTCFPTRAHTEGFSFLKCRNLKSLNPNSLAL